MDIPLLPHRATSKAGLGLGGPGSERILSGVVYSLPATRCSLLILGIPFSDFGSFARQNVFTTEYTEHTE